MMILMLMPIRITLALFIALMMASVSLLILIPARLLRDVSHHHVQLNVNVPKDGMVMIVK